MIEYEYLNRLLIGMATRDLVAMQKIQDQKKKRRKMRLSLRQNKIKKTDDYKDSLGWTQNAGRVLSDAPKAVEPEIIIVQCEMCGSRLKIPKPKKHRYTVSCSYSECNRYAI